MDNEDDSDDDPFLPLPTAPATAKQHTTQSAPRSHFTSHGWERPEAEESGYNFISNTKIDGRSGNVIITEPSANDAIKYVPYDTLRAEAATLSADDRTYKQAMEVVVARKRANAESSVSEYETMLRTSARADFDDNDGGVIPRKRVRRAMDAASVTSSSATSSLSGAPKSTHSKDDDDDDDDDDDAINTLDESTALAHLTHIPVACHGCFTRASAKTKHLSKIDEMIPALLSNTTLESACIIISRVYQSLMASDGDTSAAYMTPSRWYEHFTQHAHNMALALKDSLSYLTTIEKILRSQVVMQTESGQVVCSKGLDNLMKLDKHKMALYSLDAKGRNPFGATDPQVLAQQSAFITRLRPVSESAKAKTRKQNDFAIYGSHH